MNENLETHLRRAREAAEEASAKLDELRDERERSNGIVRAVVAAGLALMLSMFAVLVMLYQQQQQTEKSREGSREILRTLLSYSDPNSERSKASAANTQRVIEQLVEEFSEVVDRGVVATTRATLEIRRCAFGSLDEFEACIREALPRAVFEDPAE